MKSAKVSGENRHGDFHPVWLVLSISHVACLHLLEYLFEETTRFEAQVGLESDNCPSLIEGIRRRSSDRGYVRTAQEHQAIAQSATEVLQVPEVSIAILSRSWRRTSKRERSYIGFAVMGSDCSVSVTPACEIESSRPLNCAHLVMYGKSFPISGSWIVWPRIAVTSLPIAMTISSWIT